MPSPAKRTLAQRLGTPFGLGLVLISSLAACAPEEEGSAPRRESASARALESIPEAPPAEEGAFAPRWSYSGDAPLLSWIEPFGEGHRLQFARLDAEGWSAPRTVAAGDDFFANWADTPTVVDTSGGELRAYWLEKTSPDTYSYSIARARSADGGESWIREGYLNDDETLTEHGFVSTAIDGEGDLVAVWLDGRAMAEEGPMSLRIAREGETSELLDDRVCECCPTSIAAAATGLVVAYRDRSEEETRDISIVRSTEAGWTDPTPVHDDGWRIDGCPVNGPAVTARGADVAVAWFTAADDRPRVAAALSRDGGASFSPPILLDDAEPLGRVAASWMGDRVAVSWLGRAGESAVLRLQTLDGEGEVGALLTVAESAATRSSGVPVLAADEDEVFVAWTEAAEDAPLRLRAQRIAARALR